MFLEILIFLITIAFGYLINSWFKYQHNYWSRHNVPYIKPTNFFGNIKEIFLYHKCPTEQFYGIYNDELTKNEPIVGISMIHEPVLFIREPELIKKILVRDFNKFSNRFSKPNPNFDPMASHNLFFLRNPKWKLMRNKLTPIFTSGKMKQMFYLVDEIGNQLNEHLCNLTNESVNGSGVTKELKELCALYTTDVIASVAFGIQANTIKNPSGEFRTNGASIFQNTIWRAFDFNVVFFFPKLVSLIRSRLFIKEATKFLRTTINYTMNEREKSGTIRNDLIDTLIALRNESRNNDDDNDDNKFEGDVLVAQAAVFFAAGFETTSATMAFVLYELSKKLTIQERLRDEIKNVLIANNGKLTYDSVNEMVYLNMIVQETLRMYPPLGYLERECVLDKNESDYSLEPFSDFKIPHGMPIFISPYGLQRDPKYFSDPNEFNPERFNADNKNSIKSYTYMPFGIGPHNCIGERFGLMQTKIGLINILRNHEVLSCDKSQKSVEFEPRAFLLQAKGGIYCSLKWDPLI